MSKFETGEPMRYGSIGFDSRHCWTVMGSDSRGGVWMTRYIPGMRGGINTLQDAETAAKNTATRMNDMGASVKAIKQHLDINDLWQDS